MSTPLSAADYYDFFPSAEHYPGDIWSSLPTFGILPQAQLAGLVVTPACDLSNRKVETITYIPILPIRDYLISRSSLPELKRAIEGQLTAGGMGAILQFQQGYEWPGRVDITAALELIADRVNTSGVSQKEKSALIRAACGLRLLGALYHAEPYLPALSDLRELVGEKIFNDMTRRLITNGRSDVHFLPSDEQRPDWSGVPVHSVALFRFPLTIPIEVFDFAQRVSESQWTAALLPLKPAIPCVEAFPERPMKRLRLRHRFMNDLLTRFTAMFGRLGSPDFTSDTVSRFTSEIQEIQ